MANAFRDYVPAGDPDLSRARGAAVADLAVGAAVGVLTWPFPVMRVAFTGLAGSAGAGWAVHVPALLAFMVLAAWACSSVLLWLGRRTVGMYFADLGFSEPPASGAVPVTAARWTVAGLAGAVGARRPAERFATERLRSTKAGA